jgi:ribosomal protein L21E
MIACFRTLLYCLLVNAIAIAVAVAALSASPSFVRCKQPLLATATNRKVLESNTRRRLSRHQRSSVGVLLVMRDTSASYWFQRGDMVQVVADNVVKAGINLQNRIGRVVETWEKCDVDPTCCCAEQVDINMAVRVEFQGTESDPNTTGVSFLHYFAEDELLQIPATSTIEEDETAHYKAASGSTTASLPFDGMSCTAFKLDHLQSASQKQRNIFKWEPGAPQPLKEEHGHPADHQ